jgi:HAD superfamily hydrolase (TIGR01509 family)
MKLKGIIFDGDGVLFDTENLHATAWKNFLPSYNINLTVEDFKDGIGVEDKFFLKKLKEKGKIPESIEIEELVKKKSEKLQKILDITEIKISEEIKKILKYSKGKYKIAIASNSEKKFIFRVVEKLEISHFFDLILTRDDVVNPKPFPDIYKLASKKINVNPENLIAFEDSETGIISAKSAGIFCVGIKSTSDLEKLKMADIIINELNFENFKKIIDIFTNEMEKFRI